MGLKDMFVPQWKHSNPKIRREALKNLTDEKLLSDIVANDSDINVQREALKRIKGRELLQNLKGTHSLSSEIKKEVEDILRGIDRESILGEIKSLGDSTSEQIVPKVSSLFERLSEADLILLTEEITSPVLLKAILPYIKSEKAIFELIQESLSLKNYQDDLLERITDTHYLRRIAREATSKRLRKKAQQRLDLIAGPTQMPEAKIQQLLTNLLDDLDAFALTFNPENFLNRREEFEHKWEELDPSKKHLLRGRFEKKMEALEQKVATFQQTLKNLEHDVTELLTISSPITPEQESWMKEVQTRWPSTAQKYSSLPNIALLLERFERHIAMIKHEESERQKAIRHHASRVQQLKQTLSQLENFTRDRLVEKVEQTKTAWDELEARWQNSYFHHDETEPLKERFIKAKDFFLNKLGTISEKEEMFKKLSSEATHILEQFPSILSALSNNEEGTDIIGAEKRVKELQAQWKELMQKGAKVEQDLWDRFKNYCDEFYKKHQSYWQDRQWAQWAAGQKKEELIKKVQTLFAEKGESTQGLGTALGDIFQNWKALGPTVREKEQELWETFKALCDAGWGRCLKRKEELYAELQQVLAPIKDSESQPGTQPETEGSLSNSQTPINFKELSPLVKKIQDEWLDIGRLPKALEQELQTHFQQLCQSFYDKRQRFFEKRDGERGQNLEAKKNILQNVETLLQSDLVSHEKAKQLRLFQQEWKNIGPIPQSEGNELWERFQNLTQTFFATFDAEKEKNLELKMKILSECKDLTQSLVLDNETSEANESDIERLTPEIKNLQRQWKEIGPVPQDKHQELYDEFTTLCNKFFDKRKEHLEVENSELEANQVKKELIIQKMQELKLSKAWKETAEEIKKLQEEWRQVGPSKEEGRLWKSFRESCDYFFNERQLHFQKLDGERKGNLQQKQDICRIVQVLAHLAITDKELPPVREEDMADHLKLAFKYKQHIVVEGDPKMTRQNAIKEVISLQDRWKKIGPVPHEQNETLWQEFRTLCDLFFERKEQRPPSSTSHSDSDAV